MLPVGETREQMRRELGKVTRRDIEMGQREEESHPGGQFGERVGAMGARSRPGRGAVFRAGRAAVSLRLGGVGECEREGAESTDLSALNLRE